MGFGIFQLIACLALIWFALQWIDHEPAAALALIAVGIFGIVWNVIQFILIMKWASETKSGRLT